MQTNLPECWVRYTQHADQDTHQAECPEDSLADLQYTIFGGLMEVILHLPPPYFIDMYHQQDCLYTNLAEWDRKTLMLDELPYYYVPRFQVQCMRIGRLND